MLSVPLKRAFAQSPNGHFREVPMFDPSPRLSGLQLWRVLWSLLGASDGALHDFFPTLSTLKSTLQSAR